MLILDRGSVMLNGPAVSAGAVLPVWKEVTAIVLSKEARQRNGRPRVLRASLDDGTRLTGTSYVMARNTLGAVCYLQTFWAMYGLSWRQGCDMRWAFEHGILPVHEWSSVCQL